MVNIENGKNIQHTYKEGSYNVTIVAYNAKGDKTEGWVLSYEKSEITISPNKKSFDEILYNYQRKEKLNWLLLSLILLSQVAVLWRYLQGI